MNTEMTDIRPSVQKDIIRRNVSVYFVGYDQAVEAQAVPITRGTEVEPTITMSHEQAAELMTELWREGYRPQGFDNLRDEKQQMIDTLQEMLTRYKAIVKSLVDMPGL